MVRRNLLGNLTRSMMTRSLPALPSVPPDQFYGTLEVSNALVMRVESTSRRIAQTLEHQEAQLRVQLQTEEFMMTSTKESFRETSESERQSCCQRTRIGDCFSKRNVAGVYSLGFLEKKTW